MSEKTNCIRIVRKSIIDFSFGGIFLFSFINLLLCLQFDVLCEGERERVRERKGKEYGNAVWRCVLGIYFMAFINCIAHRLFSSVQQKQQSL